MTDPAETPDLAAKLVAAAERVKELSDDELSVLLRLAALRIQVLTIHSSLLAGIIEAEQDTQRKSN